MAEAFRALLGSLGNSSPELAALLANLPQSGPRGGLPFMARTAKPMDRMGSTLFGPERWRRWQLLAVAHLSHVFLLALFRKLQRSAPRWPTNGGGTG